MTSGSFNYILHQAITNELWRIDKLKHVWAFYYIPPNRFYDYAFASQKVLLVLFSKKEPKNCRKILRQAQHKNYGIFRLSSLIAL